MRAFAIATLAAMLVAPAAQAQDLCATFKRAIEVGKQDKNFAALASNTPAPQDFECEVTVEDGRGFYACETAVKAGEAPDRAQALAEEMSRCLGVDAEVEDNAGGYSADLVLRADPDLRVAIIGISFMDKVFMNVIAR